MRIIETLLLKTQAYVQFSRNNAFLPHPRGQFDPTENSSNLNQHHLQSRSLIAPRSHAQRCAHPNIAASFGAPLNAHRYDARFRRGDLWQHVSPSCPEFERLSPMKTLSQVSLLCPVVHRRSNPVFTLPDVYDGLVMSVSASRHLISPWLISQGRISDRKSRKKTREYAPISLDSPIYGVMSFLSTIHSVVPVDSGQKRS